MTDALAKLPTTGEEIMDQPLERDPNVAISAIEEQECRELLSSTTVGRVAFVSRDGVQIIPVNYIVHDGGVIFCTSHAGILSQLAGGEPDVAFEVDYHGTTGPRGWSVLVKGSVAAMTPDQLVDRAEWPRLAPWAGGDRTLFLRLTPSVITGRRVSRPSTRPGARSADD